MAYPYKTYRKSNPFSFFIILVLFAAGLIFAGFGYWGFLQKPLDPNSGVKVFVVKKGEGPFQIADRLEKEGFIRSAQVFKYLYKSSNQQPIEAGDYKISASMDPSEIIKVLSSGSIGKWVTLLEGWRLEQVAEKLNAELGIKNTEFLKAAKGYEGYLFPDTYLINKDSTPQSVVTKLNNTFKQRFDESLQNKIKKTGLTPDEGVILASIVEREARSDAVRTKVAGILLKRLKMGMKLDADATVQYAKDSQAFRQNGKVERYWQGVTRADYKNVVSDYNTYLINGLPPTPICNPSLSSLNAVANADPSTPFLYYYHDPKGNSYYAKTLEEHEQNVANNR